MLKNVAEKLKGTNRDFLLFIIAGIFLGVAASAEGSILANFLKEKLHFMVLERAALEIPRELPGFLVFLVIGSLYALGDIRISVIANILAAIGMFLFAGIPTSNYWVIVMFSFVFSMGTHIWLPMQNSIGMSFAGEGNVGRKLGQISAANTAALVTSSAIIWALFNFLKMEYWVAFAISGVAFLLAAFCIGMMNPRQTVRAKNRFVFRKEYKLYYWLCILYGARKQIFITFGPWVLVDVFKQPVTTMTILFFAISFLGVFAKPFVGHLIDKVGEKVILGGEAVILVVVCLGYAFAADFLPPHLAVLFICGCYVIDQTSNAVSMARSTFARKIALVPEDVSPTLSLGISLDHIVSMLLPFFAGYLWYANGEHGYKYVFIGGAVIALINFISCRFIDIKPRAIKEAEQKVQIT